MQEKLQEISSLRQFFSGIVRNKNGNAGCLCEINQKKQGEYWEIPICEKRLLKVYFVLFF